MRIQMWITRGLMGLLCTLTGPMSWSNEPVSNPWMIQVEGSINPGSANYIIDNIRLAGEAGVPFLIVQMNTPGGLLSSTRDIIQAMNQSPVPIVMYVSPSGGSATSAGALITLASHIAVMNKGTNIGAAHPVGVGGDSPKGAMEDKAVEDTAAMARAQAEIYGRNVKLAEEIVTNSKSYTADEALKNKLIEAVVEDLDGLLKAVHGRKVKIADRITEINTVNITSAKVVQKQMNPKQQFLHLIADPNVSTLLLSLAGLAIYTEISSGFSLLAPGVIGVLLLILGFVSLQMLPITAGGSALLGIGFALLLAELFVTSYGLLAIAGIVSLMLGSLFLIDSQFSAGSVSPELLVTLSLSMVTIIAGLGYLIWRDSRIVVTSGVDALIGQLAKIDSVLDGGREGVLTVQGEIWNFKSNSNLQVGDSVKVLAFNGECLLVEKA